VENRDTTLPEKRSRDRNLSRQIFAAFALSSDAYGLTTRGASLLDRRRKRLEITEQVRKIAVRQKKSAQP